MATITLGLKETITQDGYSRQWYTINGEEYAITSDDQILDEDGCPLTEGDAETIRVRNAIG